MFDIVDRTSRVGDEVFIHLPASESVGGGRGGVYADDDPRRTGATGRYDAELDGAAIRSGDVVAHENGPGKAPALTFAP